MRDMPDESSDLQVVIEDDDETPLEFVIDLVRSVFGQSDAQVRIFTETIERDSKAVCGIYPPAVAEAKLQTGELTISDALVGEAVARTKGVSAAFIKELIRRTAQSSIMRGAGEAVASDDLAEALDDMLFTGGRFNIKLLGAAPDRAAAE
jgi:hypothetical protein